MKLIQDKGTVLTPIFKLLKRCIYWCARGVTVIIIGSGYGYSNSNPERYCLHFTLCL